MNALSIARSGLGVATLRLDASANNVANAQTAGYRRQFVLQEEQAEGGVTGTVGTEAAPAENLADDLVQQRLAAYVFEANVGVIRTQGRMLGSLLDLRA